ncbi:MAG TPA: hypothetical protein VK625_02005 [Flavitalea sp.]|nr:hypothetical protein [Flavitalea sp.]
MKSILFIAFLAIATIGCDTPESTTGTESAPPMSDSTSTTDSASMSTPTDTVTTTPVDTTSTLPVDTSTTR